MTTARRPTRQPDLARRTAVLLDFPDGVDKQDAERTAQMMIDLLMTYRPHSAPPTVAEVKEYVAEHGDVTIYQP